MMTFYLILAIIYFTTCSSLATKLSKAEENARKFPEYRSGQYQGDIDLSQMIDWRNGIRKKSMRWPNGKVPFEFTDNYPTNSRAKIRAALHELESKVNADGYSNCIDFVETKSNKGDNFVLIEDIPTCMSPVGMIGGEQRLALGSEYCLDNAATVQHEMLHALGFWHEQARTDRDKYVKIIFENISQGQLHNFNMETENMDLLNTPYNYHSILHYDEYAFSINGEYTIIPLEPGIDLSSRTFEGLDVERVRLLYECATTESGVGDNSDCKDERTDCGFYLDSGYCKVRVQQMQLNCAKTCNFC